MEANQPCEACPTRRLCLGADLDEAGLEALGDCVRPSAPMARGDHLYRAGDAAGSCYVVRSGVYKTSVLSGGGEEHVTGFHFPGDLIGLAGQATGVHRETARALETSTACRVPLKGLPALWELGSGGALLRLVGLSEQRGFHHQVNLSRPAADARVAGFLVSLAHRMRRQGRSRTTLPLPMSRTDLANHLGMTLECLSRVLARLGKAGLIDAARNSVTIDDPDALQALAGYPDA